MKIDRKGILLNSGKEILCHSSYIGIGQDLDIVYGCDGSINEYVNSLTKEERVEIADYMIELWKRYKEGGK